MEHALLLKLVWWGKQKTFGMWKKAAVATKDIVLLIKRREGFG